MGYFDDPKHKAQWEKELSELRREKARIKAGLPPVSEQPERTVSKNIEKSAPKTDFSFAEKTENTAEETKFYRSEEHESARKEPAKRVHGDGNYRVKISFQELLRAENMEQPVKLTQKPREMTRQKEVSHEL